MRVRKLAGMLAEPLHAGAAPLRYTADQLRLAGSRLLICQRDSIAAMLLANDLPVERGAAVLGDSQVAAGLADLLREAVERGATTVYLLHDATAAGTAWRIDVAGRVVALGLHPDQARALHYVRGPAGGAELAAVRPAHLLRVLRRVARRCAPARGPTSVWERAHLGFLSWPGERS